jgi:hypothetical protein
MFLDIVYMLYSSSIERTLWNAVKSHLVFFMQHESFSAVFLFLTITYCHYQGT